MSKKKIRDSSAGSAPLSPLSPPQWTGVRALKLIHDLNERCFELLGQLAHTGCTTTCSVVIAYRTLWRELDHEARRRAACGPVLMMDLHFRNTDWWRGTVSQRRRGAGIGYSMGHFPRKMAEELTRETLTVAWVTAGLDTRAASLVLGAVPSVVQVLETLGPQDIERIAAQHNRALRLRWDEHPAFWCSLLNAALEGDEEKLQELHHYGLQLLGGEVIPQLDRLAQSDRASHAVHVSRTLRRGNGG